LNSHQFSPDAILTPSWIDFAGSQSAPPLLAPERDPHVVVVVELTEVVVVFVVVVKVYVLVVTELVVEVV